MTEQFAAPSAPGGDPLDLNAMLGALLVVDVTEVVEHVQTVNTLPGEKTPAVRGTVHVLDGALAGTTREDALIFPRVLQSQLRGNVGRKVLGRLRKGAAKPGKNAPWELAPATEADYAAATRWSMGGAASNATATAPF